MEETKFKAWDGKRMWNVTEIVWRTPKQGGKIAFVRGVYGDEELPIGGHADYIDISKIKLLRLWRLDMKNNPIFQNDIVLYHKDLWSGKEFKNEKYVVKFGEGTFDSGYYHYQGFYLKRINLYGQLESGDLGHGYNDELMKYIEGIGNIYENTELLKEINNEETN